MSLQLFLSNIIMARFSVSSALSYAVPALAIFQPFIIEAGKLLVLVNGKIAPELLGCLAQYATCDNRDLSVPSLNLIDKGLRMSWSVRGGDRTALQTR